MMAEIVERTDGNPLFVEEMTKAMLEAEGEGNVNCCFLFISEGRSQPPWERGLGFRRVS